MPPEPARPLSAEAPSQRRPKARFWVLHSAKGNSSSSKPHPLLALAHESSASCFRPWPCALHRAKRGRTALAPWALMLCWGSPAPETHSKWVLLRGQVGLGVLCPSSPRPRPFPLSQHGRSAPRPRRSDSPKRASGSCILQRETLFQQQTTSLKRLGSGKLRKPFSPRPCALHRAKRGWAAPGSLGPADLLGVSGTRITLHTGSPSWASRTGRAKSF